MSPGGSVMQDVQAITELLYRYCMLMDAGDFDGASAMFSKARVRMPAMQDVPGQVLRDIWHKLIVIYPCGTPRTQHMVFNPIVTVDADRTTASCQSRYLVVQQTDDFPLQMIAAGQYEDRFARDDGGWHFTFRDYSHLKLPGDLSHHLRSGTPHATPRH